MKQQTQRPTLPTFGEVVPGEGGRLGAIMRGPVVGGIRQPDYAIIVPDLPAKALTWGKRGQDIAGAKSQTDGLANTAAMLAAKCPPALHIATLKTADGHADLYLPARAELQALYANVPELFDKAWHWSSTQGSSSLAFSQTFDDGWSYWSLKVSDYRVRAVRRIPLQHFPT
jgi:hypothetical protein